MEDEVVCPNCFGLKCMFERWHSLIGKGYKLTICYFYNFEGDCYKHSTCIERCYICNGLGKISWIDYLFYLEEDSRSSSFSKLKSTILDESNEWYYHQRWMKVKDYFKYLK